MTSGLVFPSRLLELSDLRRIHPPIFKVPLIKPNILVHRHTPRVATLRYRTCSTLPLRHLYIQVILHDRCCSTMKMARTYLCRFPLVVVELPTYLHTLNQQAAFPETLLGCGGISSRFRGRILNPTVDGQLGSLSRPP